MPTAISLLLGVIAIVGRIVLFSAASGAQS